jgi:hypothetical protein
MTEPRSDDRSQARREAATLLGVDIDHLSPADGLRVDMISALRLVIDHEQATVLDGGSADLGKLNVAVASLIALLPNRQLPGPASSREDPRARLLALIMEQRERDGIPDEGTTRATINAQAAEIAQLRARLGDVPPTPDSAGCRKTHALARGETSGGFVGNPPEVDIVPPGERADRDPGQRPRFPDDRKPVTIEGKAVVTNVTPEPAPAADADAVDIRGGFDDRPEPWRDHMTRHYDPWADNR